jgi:recombination protein RecA
VPGRGTTFTGCEIRSDGNGDGKPLDLNDKRDMDKQKALESALAQIERQFGKGSIMKLGADNPAMDIEATSTGSLGLDIALGIGGLPKGRIIEIYGPESRARPR